MRAVQIWDYLMRRKPLLVAFFVVIASGFCGYQFAAKHRVVHSENLVVAPVAQSIDNGLALQIMGENQTPVYTLSLDDKFQQANIEVKADLLDSEAYVRILDATGNLITGDYTALHDGAKSNGGDNATGVKYYFSDAPKAYQVALTPGMRIELHAQNVQFYSSLDGNIVTEYAPRAIDETYVVMHDGLRRDDWSEAQAQDVLYQQLSRYINQQITQYMIEIPEHVLHNKALDVTKKAEIVRLYTQLTSADQASYTDFITQLQRGGIPTITYRGKTEYKIGDKVDFLDFIDIYDNEDGEIAKESLRSEGVVDFSQPGSYRLKYIATDSDGNTTELELMITIIDKKVDAPDQIPGEDRPIDTPVDDNISEDNISQPSQPDENLSSEGVGVTIDEEAAGVTGTIWGALAARVDYEPSTEETEVITDIKEEAGGESKPIDEASGHEVSERETETASSNTDQKPTSQTESPEINLFFVILGILAVCGLIKFIFDHYIR